MKGFILFSFIFEISCVFLFFFGFFLKKLYKKNFFLKNQIFLNFSNFSKKFEKCLDFSF